MKLVTFVTQENQTHIGAVSPGNGVLVDFTAASGEPCFRDMLSLIDAGDRGLERARELLERRTVEREISRVRLLAPLPVPRQMRDFLVFEKHLRQARANRYLVPNSGFSERVDPEGVQIPAAWYEMPLYYRCGSYNVIGPETDIVCPSYTSYLDFELEFGMVLGKKGKNIQREAASEHVFGYCIFNDVSARDMQFRCMPSQLGPGKGKDFDTSNVLGPWLVTRDEITDPYNLTMFARINGEECSRGSSAEMHHSFEDMIAYASKDETVLPGDFFGSGTVGGGCGLEIGRFLKIGDVIELEISGLGVLRNRVVASSAAQ